MTINGPVDHKRIHSKFDQKYHHEKYENSKEKSEPRNLGQIKNYSDRKLNYAGMENVEVRNKYREPTKTSLMKMQEMLRTTQKNLASEHKI